MKPFFFTIIFLIPLFSFSQKDKDNYSSEYIDIDKLIIKKESDKKQKSFLISFKNVYGKDNKLAVCEQKDQYEIIVSHPAKNGYTGGAEAYSLDKETGKSEMIWHEHPMKIDGVEEEK